MLLLEDKKLSTSIKAFPGNGDKGFVPAITLGTWGQATERSSQSESLPLRADLPFWRSQSTSGIDEAVVHSRKGNARRLETHHEWCRLARG